MSELHYLSAAEQAELIEAREISPVDLMRATLARIDKYDGILNAWINVDADAAMAAAGQAESDIAKGLYRGPLHGLPFGVKDQMHVEGFPTTLGTRVLTADEMVAPTTATVVQKLRHAGAILIGKQNLHEFGKGGTIDFPYGQPRNPWGLGYSASSSSTGSGIAPAAGMCSFSIGEDTGGSIRGPASYNGVVGLRPTFGRVSRHGGVMHAYTSDTIGPLARTVEDTALVLSAIAGYDPEDTLSSDEPVPSYIDGLRSGIKGLRLAIVREMSSDDVLDPEVRKAFLAAIDILAAAGAEIEEISLPYAKYAIPLQFLSADVDVGAYFLQNYLRDRYDTFDRGTRTRLLASSFIPSAVYNRAMRARVVVRRQILGAALKYDALLSPTNVSPPSLIEASQEKSDNPDEMVERHIRRRICNYPYSLANIPALSVNMGFSDAGLPMGLQIAAAPFEEAKVFRVAAAYEHDTDWHIRHPDLDAVIAAGGAS